MFFASIWQYEELGQAVGVAWNRMSPTTRENLIVLGSLASVTLLLVIWAVFFRRLFRPRHHRHHTHDRSSQPAASPASAAGGPPAPGQRKRHRWRRSGREHRPRNPTLAETGGLPPIRTHQPPQTPP
jgi:hypothetical protein